MALTVAEKVEAEAELVLVRNALNKAYSAASYLTGGGQSVTRQSIKELVKRKNQLERKLGVSSKGIKELI